MEAININFADKDCTIAVVVVVIEIVSTKVDYIIKVAVE